MACAFMACASIACARTRMRLCASVCVCVCERDCVTAFSRDSCSVFQCSFCSIRFSVVVPSIPSGLCTLSNRCLPFGSCRRLRAVRYTSSSSSSSPLLISVSIVLASCTSGHRSSKIRSPRLVYIARVVRR